MELAFKTKPELQKYADRLRKLDTDGNGELELEEVAQVIEELVEAENSRRLLKWFSAVMACLLLLTVAATVGLTYAVVAITKDIKADNNLMISKANGEPMLVGSPTIAVIYDPADAASLAELFNTTSTMADLSNGAAGGRRLQAAADYCANPEVQALAMTTAAYVEKKCNYISQPGTDSQFTLKVQPSVNGECTVADRRSTTSCSTYRDLVQVTSDQCDLFTRKLSCTTPGQSYTVGLLWADSILRTERHASYLINCVGTCGQDKIVAFSKCGVARSRCMSGSGSLPGARGRKLQQDADTDDSTPMNNFSVYWN
ncbi:hypothetical protein Ndes2526B_g03900 [Nannochloris sp. 'desiccata']|nr:hypothetical protein KSW81_005237 [Chlorella desiccata (nom. nud.)]KAH7621564.1 hypothetical protein NADE_006825 [Chlorella desiccata (nom. nud.)]